MLRRLSRRSMAKKPDSAPPRPPPMNKGLLGDIAKGKSLKKAGDDGDDSGGGSKPPPGKPMSLLDQIQAGKALKKVGSGGDDSGGGSKPPPGKPMSLLDQIQAGKALKKVGSGDDKKPVAPPPKKPMSLQEQLAARMKKSEKPSSKPPPPSRQPSPAKNDAEKENPFKANLRPTNGPKKGEENTQKKAPPPPPQKKPNNVSPPPKQENKSGFNTNLLDKASNIGNSKASKNSDEGDDDSDDWDDEPKTVKKGNSLENDLQALKVELEALKNQKKGIESDLLNVNRELENTKRKLRSTENENETLKKDKEKALSNASEAQKQELELYKGDLKKCNEELNAEKEKNKDLTTKNTTLEAELSQTRSKLLELSSTSSSTTTENTPIGKTDSDSAVNDQQLSLLSDELKRAELALGKEREEHSKTKEKLFNAMESLRNNSTNDFSSSQNLSFTPPSVPQFSSTTPIPTTSPLPGSTVDLSAFSNEKRLREQLKRSQSRELRAMKLLIEVTGKNHMKEVVSALESGDNAESMASLIRQTIAREYTTAQKFKGLLNHNKPVTGSGSTKKR